MYHLPNVILTQQCSQINNLQVRIQNHFVGLHELDQYSFQQFRFIEFVGVARQNSIYFLFQIVVNDWVESGVLLKRLLEVNDEWLGLCCVAKSATFELPLNIVNEFTLAFQLILILIILILAVFCNHHVGTVSQSDHLLLQHVIDLLFNFYLIFDNVLLRLQLKKKICLSSLSSLSWCTFKISLLDFSLNFSFSWIAWVVLSNSCLTD